LRDNWHAQDAVSETFIKILENLHKIDCVDCNKTKWFVVIICRNLCFNILAKKSKDNELLLGDELDTIMINDTDLLMNITADEGVTQIMNALNKIKTEYADILRLKIAFDYDDKQLAKLLNISYVNYRSRLSRAKKALKVILIRDGVISGK